MTIPILSLREDRLILPRELSSLSTITKTSGKTQEQLTDFLVKLNKKYN